MIIVDGKDLVLGRLASFVAKRLLDGETVSVVNSEQAIISGRKEATLDGYKAWLQTRNVSNPRKGPFHLKRPDAIVRYSVRGMLPFSTSRGRTAFHRLRAYVGVPEELTGKEMVPIPDANLENLGSRRFIRVGDLSKRLGASF